MKIVPDWFVTQELTDLWDDNNGDEDNFFEWYDGHKKRKVQKAQIFNARYMVSIKVVGLVYVRRREKETEKLWDKYRPFFVYGDRIQKHFFERSIKFGPCPAQEVKNYKCLKD